MSSEDAAEEAAPEELMPSVCWIQLEKLLPEWHCRKHCSWKAPAKRQRHRSGEEQYGE